MFDSTCPRPSRVNIHHCCFVIIYFIYKMLLKKVAVINPHTSATFQLIDSLITPEHVDNIAAFSRNVTRSLLKYLRCASSTLRKIIFIFFIFYFCPNQYTINRFSTFYIYIVGRRSQQVFANFSLGDPLFLNIFYCYII